MKFSIIVPVYNVEAFLDKCINSIIGQSFSDLELILVDDGSTDNCPDICDKYKEKDSRVIVIHKKNEGLVLARKSGLKLAHGEYILSVDGDDFIDVDLLNNLNSIIDLNNSPDLVAFGYFNTTIDDQIDGKVRNTIEPGLYSNDNKKNLTENLLYNLSDKSHNTGNLIYSIWSKAIKRELLLPFQFAVPDQLTNGEDVACVIPCVLAAKSVFVSDYCGYYYRSRESSMVHKFSENEIVSYEMLIRFLNNSSFEEKKICAYGFRVLLGHFSKAAKHFNKFKLFSDYCNSIVRRELWNYILHAFHQPCLSVPNSIRVFCVKKHIWLLIWIRYAMINKG